MNKQIIQEAANKAKDVEEIKEIPELTDITDLIFNESLSLEELGELLTK